MIKAPCTFLSSRLPGLCALSLFPAALAAEDAASGGFAALHRDLEVGEQTIFVHTSAFPGSVDRLLEHCAEWVPFLNEAFPDTPMEDLDPVCGYRMTNGTG